jgi:hypothetical protein
MDKFKTRYRLKDGWALLSYKDDEGETVPVYVEPNGSLSFQFEKAGTLEEIELMIPGDNILVDGPTWNSLWTVTKGMFMHIDPRSVRRR